MYKKIPTAVFDFDDILSGGIPNGSLVILSGEPGAGAIEFALTSIIKLAIAKSDPERKNLMFGRYGDSIYIPTYTYFISFTKSRKEVERIVDLNFDVTLASRFRENLIFQDFSRLYFRKSKVPKAWIGDKLGLLSEERDLLMEFVNYLTTHGEDSVMVIDSLTDLIVSPYIEQNEVIDIIKGLEKLTKKRNGVTYLLLTDAIADKRVENMLFDTVDGIIKFRWQGSEKYYARSRFMYVLKFTGVLSHLEEEKIIRFNTTLKYNSGFVVVYTERIR